MSVEERDELILDQEFQDEERDAEEGEEKEITEQDERSIERGDIEEIARKNGWNPNGPLDASEYLRGIRDREKKKRSTISEDFRRYRRETSESFRRMEEKINGLTESISSGASESAQRRVHQLEKELETAKENGDVDRALEIQDSLIRERGKIKPNQTNSARTNRAEYHADDYNEVFEDWEDANPWVNENKEVKKYFADELKYFSRQGKSPRQALREAKKSAMEEFPDLFRSRGAGDGAEERRTYSPPVGRGRTPSNVRDGGTKTIADIKDRSDADHLRKSALRDMAERNIPENDRKQYNEILQELVGHYFRENEF